MKTRLAAEFYEEITKVSEGSIRPFPSTLLRNQTSSFLLLKKPADNKTLIAILASCGALLIMIVILAVCASHHRRPYGENQVGQRLSPQLPSVGFFCALEIRSHDRNLSIITLGEKKKRNLVHSKH